MDEEGTPTSASAVAGTAENIGGDASGMGSRSEFGGRSTADIPENGHNPEVSHGADEHRQKQHHHEPAAEVHREGHGGETEPANEKRTGGGRDDGQPNRVRPWSTCRRRNRATLETEEKNRR
jgi:hypothetical protein